MFTVNQVVQATYGTFIILGFITIGDEPHAKVKAYDPTTGRKGKGQLALPVSILKAI